MRVARPEIGTSPKRIYLDGRVGKDQKQSLDIVIFLTESLAGLARGRAIRKRMVAGENRHDSQAAVKANSHLDANEIRLSHSLLSRSESKKYEWARARQTFMNRHRLGSRGLRFARFRS